MKKKTSTLHTALFIVSAVWIILAAAVTVLIFATNNSYSEPVFGETMLVSVREGSPKGTREGSLAVVDLKGHSNSEYYAVFIGGGVRVSQDKMANIGTVKAFIPALGAAIDFFRNSLGFFLVVVLPLAAMVIWYIVRVFLLIRDGNEVGKAKNMRGAKSAKDNKALPAAGTDEARDTSEDV